MDGGTPVGRGTAPGSSPARCCGTRASRHPADGEGSQGRRARGNGGSGPAWRGVRGHVCRQRGGRRRRCRTAIGRRDVAGGVCCFGGGHSVLDVTFSRRGPHGRAGRASFRPVAMEGSDAASSRPARQLREPTSAGSSRQGSQAPGRSTCAPSGRQCAGRSDFLAPSWTGLDVLRSSHGRSYDARRRRRQASNVAVRVRRSDRPAARLRARMSLRRQTVDPHRRVLAVPDVGARRRAACRTFP